MDGEQKKQSETLGQAQLGIIPPGRLEELERLAKKGAFLREGEVPKDSKRFLPGCCFFCGWDPADPSHPPNFCPECGNPFPDISKTVRVGEQIPQS